MIAPLCSEIARHSDVHSRAASLRLCLLWVESGQARARVLISSVLRPKAVLFRAHYLLALRLCSTDGNVMRSAECQSS